MIRNLGSPALLLALLTAPLFAVDVDGKNAASLLLGNEVRFYWSSGDKLLAYRVNTGRDEYRFFLIDPVTGKKSPAFDHDLLGNALGKAANRPVEPKRLPVESLAFLDPLTFRFRAFGKSWSYSIPNNQVSPDGFKPESTPLIAPEIAMRGTRRNGVATELTIENGTPGEIEVFWIDPHGQRSTYGKIAPGKNSVQHTYAGHVWLGVAENGEPLAGVEAPEAPATAIITEQVKSARKPAKDLSPDGKWQALIRNHNLIIKPVGRDLATALTTDGSEDDSYTSPLEWSPDSQKIVASRVKKVVERQIHIVQSSPQFQLQPNLLTLNYAKPGDEIRQPMPHLFDVSRHREIPIDHALFPNPWEISDLAWATDSSEFSFVYNQRGHQLMRIVGVRGDSGSARTIYQDASNTFIDYSQKFFIHRLPATREFLWASERDGYNHLNLIDSISGSIKNAVTQGNWNVREVIQVDDQKRRLLIKMMGVPDQDPYHEHYAWVNFDGSKFIRLTTGDGNHQIDLSPDKNYLIDTWSRVDQPPIVELRRADDGKLVTEIARADDHALLATGWTPPERFTAKGRDGKTDIYGIIIRPSHFDPAKKYPILEDIYAGPQDHFVPKTYFPWSGKNTMAEMGFIVVSIDGMGTNWRSKAFHDVCWKNLADSGFPDRIPWIKSAAASRPWMDLSRVGIYGGSAGGQNALAGLLDHGDFYKVGVADCGCHDNRMDKIWWNEAWMGWPVDESYERNSNVTRVSKLTGKLLLMVGELDRNVDPASTAQVVNALEKAGKDFEFLPIMNSDHGAAETPYGSRRRAEFLVRNLIGNP